MALLHILVSLAEHPASNIHVAHFDHRSRENSAAAADFVAKTCERWGISFHTGAIPHAPPRGMSPEHFWRNARYAFLESCRRKTGAAGIATGHTADDQLETFIFRWLSGCGPRGLLGIRLSTETHIVRPLLYQKKSRLLAYLHQNEIPFLEDQTNRDISYPRNYIRHNIVPALVAFSPAIHQHTQTLMELLKAEDEWISSRISSMIEQTGWKGSLPFTMAADEAASLPLALQRRLALAILHRIALPPSVHITRHLVDALVELFRGNASNIQLPGDIRGYRAGGRIRIIENPSPVSPQSVPLVVPGDTRFGMWTIWSKLSGIPETFPAADTALVIRKLQGLSVRSRRPGDTFRQMGMKGKIKLKKLFNARKIPREYRDSFPLIVHPELSIVAIPMIGVSRDAAISPGSKESIKITWQSRADLW